MKSELWNYAVLQAFNELHYKNLLTRSMLTKGRTPFRLNKGTESEETRVFYIIERDHHKFLLPEEAFEDLPLVPTQTKDLNYGRDVYDVITEYKSAKFRAEKHMNFRKLVDSFIPFAHAEPLDFILWKIIVLAAYITRFNVRVSSRPAFGKDSALKTLQGLFGDVVVVSNPTIAKMEYCLTNKLLMLNEVTNLERRERREVEQFLLAAGDLSNTYTKRSRSQTSSGTQETYNIGHLSLFLAYNDKDCYPGKSYFDDMFQKAVMARFLPLRFKGAITEHITTPSNAAELATENREWFRQFVQSVMWYKENWQGEVGKAAELNGGLRGAAEYGFQDRWLVSFSTIRDFIRLYSTTLEEAQGLLDALYDRHIAYQRMLKEGIDDDLTIYKQEPESGRGVAHGKPVTEEDIT